MRDVEEREMANRPAERGVEGRLAGSTTKSFWGRQLSGVDEQETGMLQR
jgi:hypothetical protein